MKVSADAGGCFPTGRHYAGIAHLMRAVVRGTAEEYPADTLMTDLPLVSIDVEATGLDPQEDRVVEVACVIFHAGKVERHGWLVNPGCPIPAESQAIHHISDEDVKDAPRFGDKVGELLELLGRGVPLAYNADFDRAFLLAEFERCGSHHGSVPAAFRKGVQWIDPLVWARHLQANEKSKSLTAVAERLGIEIGQAHRATDDAEAAGHVMQRFLKEPDLPPNYGAFIQEQRVLARQQRDARPHWRS